MTRLDATVMDVWKVAFADLLDELARTPWDRERRDSALERFRALGFPSTKEEAWRQTDTRGVEGTLLREAPAARGPFRWAEADAMLLPGGPRLVFVNGRLEPSLSALGDLPEGVEVRPLAEAVGDDAEDLVEVLGRLVDGAPSLDPGRPLTRGHPFAALNTALWRGGALVRFGPGVCMAEPVHVVHLEAGAGAAPGAVHPRLLVVAEASSEGAVVETYASLGLGRTGAAFATNAVTELVLHANARLDHLKVEAEGPGVTHLWNLGARLAADSRLRTFSLALGAALARNDLSVWLEGEGAECRMDGLYLVSGKRHVDHQTNIDHVAPHCQSQQLYKGVLSERATSAFAGRILVRPGAVKTDARQANHNLLLSKEALAHSKPQLEIFNDDVKCAHGSTVGQLEEDAVFYLRTRGLSADAARALLVRAFVLEVPARIGHPALRTHVEGLLASRLPGAGA